jgi:hypothetical protein
MLNPWTEGCDVYIPVAGLLCQYILEGIEDDLICAVTDAMHVLHRKGHGYRKGTGFKKKTQTTCIFASQALRMS